MATWTWGLGPDLTERYRLPGVSGDAWFRAETGLKSKFAPTNNQGATLHRRSWKLGCAPSAS